MSLCGFAVHINVCFLSCSCVWWVEKSFRWITRWTWYLSLRTWSRRPLPLSAGTVVTGHPMVIVVMTSLCSQWQWSEFECSATQMMPANLIVISQISGEFGVAAPILWKHAPSWLVGNFNLVHNSVIIRRLICTLIFHCGCPAYSSISLLMLRYFIPSLGFKLLFEIVFTP